MPALGLHRPNPRGQSPSELRDFLEWVEALGYDCRMGVYYARHIANQGYAEEVARVQQAYAAGEDFAAAVPDRLVNALVIVGTARQCRDRLEEYAAPGVNEPQLGFSADVPASLVRETLEALAPARTGRFP